MTLATPHMDADGLAAFNEHLRRATVFLEYGAGGSTGLAAGMDNIQAVISAESDPAWVEKLTAGLAGSPARLYIDHCDIGVVGEWGGPLDASAFAGWYGYVVQPWRRAAELGLRPDLVLVDGRFRLACFLYSLLCAAEGTPILFDDYLDRPAYAVAETFCPRRETHGRLAVFRAAPPSDLPRLAEALMKYACQPGL